MFRQKKLRSLVLAFILVLILAACGGEETTPEPEPTDAPVAEPTEEMVDEAMDEEMPETIVDIAVADGRFETLVAALTAADLAGTLSGEGPFTVFAPTDDAFAALPEGTVEALLEDPAGDLAQILLYHVVAGSVDAATVTGLESATTVQGEEITIAVENGAVILNGNAEVIITDIEASNGIIHVIDVVLLPPSLVAEPLPSIAEIAVADGNFMTLVAALDAAGLVETLSAEGEFTVFAPTDDAFAALPEGTVEALLEDPTGALMDILLYHVVDGAVKAETVVTLESATTLQGEDITIAITDDGVLLNDAVLVTMTDIMASNGVIHVIDGVLLPPSMVASDSSSMSIAEIAVADGNFTTLVAALDAAGLVETLSAEGEFTVFAPTDAAFAALPEGTVEALLEDPTGALTDILLYHVVDGVVPAETVVTLTEATTLQGESVTITVTDDGVFLNDTVQVIVTDIMASNGIIHVIDGVLLPPSMVASDTSSMSIAEIAVADGNFTTLVAALDAAGLVETLSAEGEFTVFAPTDAAFAALPEGTVEALLEDPTGALTDILLYHVVDGVVPAETVVTLTEATTLQGEPITITVTDDGVFLNDTIQVIVTDIMASNGIIHVIDMVLLPPSMASNG